MSEVIEYKDAVTQ